MYNCGTVNSFSHALSIQIILLKRRGGIWSWRRGGVIEGETKNLKNKTKCEQNDPDRKQQRM